MKKIKEIFNKIQTRLSGKFSLQKIFSNNKIAFIFSLIIATILWAFNTSNNTSTQTTVRIDDIPISVQLSDTMINEGYDFFFYDKDTASVEVEGSALTVSKINKSDISVNASKAGEITQGGTYELNLSAKTQGSFSESFEINQTSLSPSVTQVLVDKKGTVELTVKDEVGFKVGSDYYASSAVFSPDTITVSGAQGLVSKIDHVSARYNIANTLTKSVDMEIPLIFYDKDNNVIQESNLSMLSISQKSVICKISVLKKATASLNVKLENKPSGFDESTKVSVSPNTLEIAFSEENKNSTDNITIYTLDFSKLNINNTTLEVPVELPAGYKNLSNVSTVSVNVDTNGYKNKSLSVDKFELSNLPSTKEASVLTKKIDVELNASEAELDQITSDNITAVVDLSGKDNFTGNCEIPVKFKVSGYSDYWIYGSYNASVEIKNK